MNMQLRGAINDLPGEVLERVLAHVPFQERCGGHRPCASVHASQSLNCSCEPSALDAQDPTLLWMRSCRIRAAAVCHTWRHYLSDCGLPLWQARWGSTP
jgi:hypothetical protein